MKEKNSRGITFKEHEEFKSYIEKFEKLGFDLDYLHYTRHTHFIPDGYPPCDICGGTKLIHGIGRYISFDEDREDDLAVFICGYCLRFLEEEWDIKTDMQ